MFSALLLVLLAGACTSGTSSLGPAGTLGPAPTSTTAHPVDVAVIPDDPAAIDEPYVQAVVDALYAVDAEATKIFVATKTVDPRAVEILDAIFIGEEFDQQVNNWVHILEQRPDEVLPGALGHLVTSVIGIADDCVFFVAKRDFSATTTNSVELSTTYLGITPKEPTDDPLARNPTAWMIFSDSIGSGGQQPENPCGDR